MGAWEAWSDSPTFDEPVYVSAGLAALSQHDLWLNDEHPPLPKVLAALPAWAAGPVVPPAPPGPLGPGAAASAERAYSATWLRAQGDRLHLEVFLARLVDVAEAAAAAALVYLIGRRLMGVGAGVVGAVVWLSSPVVIGLGHLDGINLPEAVAALGTAWALARWLDRPSSRSAAVVGLLAGLAASADASGLLLPPIAALTVAAVALRGGRGVRAAGRSALLVLVPAWAVVWAGYLVLDPTVLWRHPALLPEPYLSGLRFLNTNDTVAAPGLLLGRAWTGGRWWFWPGSLVVKLAWPALVLLGAGPLVLGLLRRRLAGAAGRTALVLLPPTAAYAAVAVRTPRDLGLRYLLPALALWTVAAGGVAAGGPGRPRRVLAAGACLLGVAAGAWSAPHSLAWTNPPFRPGYRVATDSNLDWGQDLGALRRWAAGRSARVAYFGPRGAGVPGTRALLGVPPGQVTGWVAASATALTSARRDALAWLRSYCPVGTLGGTVLVYRFGRPPHPPARAPAAPPPVCPGPYSRPG